MKLWYDDKKIPTWVEWLAVLIVGILLGLIFALGLLGITFGNFLASLF
jgi:uncharacterized protein involved in cysteine biosynthesis